MAETHEPSPEAAPPPRVRVFAADPVDRVVPVLSIEPPKKKTWTRARTLAVVRKLCVAVAAAIIAMLAFAALLDETEPGRSSSGPVSVR